MGDIECNCGSENPTSSRHGHRHMAWCAAFKRGASAPSVPPPAIEAVIAEMRREANDQETPTIVSKALRRRANDIAVAIRSIQSPPPVAPHHEIAAMIARWQEHGPDDVSECESKNLWVTAADIKTRLECADELVATLASLRPQPTQETSEQRTCDCGDALTMCVSCAVADYQAAHAACPTCCPPSDPPREEPSGKEAWRPISTAPKDRPIIVITRNGNAYKVEYEEDDFWFAKNVGRSMRSSELSIWTDFPPAQSVPETKG